MWIGVVWTLEGFKWRFDFVGSEGGGEDQQACGGVIIGCHL
jgi:hypothetical protein